MPHLARIPVYPIKSLGPSRPRPRRAGRGRRWSTTASSPSSTASGKYLNGKRTPRIHALRSAFKLTTGALCLEDGRRRRGPLAPAGRQDALECWLTRLLRSAGLLPAQPLGRLPGRPERPRPHGHQHGDFGRGRLLVPRPLGRERPHPFSGQFRDRRRAALLGGPPVRPARHRRPVPVGGITFHGVNPCQRCVVPPRDPDTGEALPDFSPVFRQRREAALPAWADRSRFNHFYRLAVNTRVPRGQAGSVLRVGDEVRLLPETV